MLMVSMVQVLPLSVVLTPEDVASLRTAVLPKFSSATSRTMVVDRYSAELSAGG